MPGDDVPPEFAETYRAAYREALDAPAGTSPPGHRRGGDPSPVPSWWSRTRLRAGLAASAALVLVAGSYVLGMALAGSGSDGREAGAVSATTIAWGRAAYAGPVRSIRVDHASASCTAPPSVDGGGHQVTYLAAHLVDGDPSSAWRCAGRGVGQRLTFELAAGARVAEVGLVPGYAKTDPVTEVDRYAQDNRITEVRWTIGQRTVVQRFSADPGDRSMRVLRIPATEASQVRLTILATAEGPRDVTAIGEVRFAAPRH